MDAAACPDGRGPRREGDTRGVGGEDHGRFDGGRGGGCEFNLLINLYIY